MSRTDRMTADLERAFEALEEGEIDAAAAILERIKRIDRKNPDVITLAAAVADATGNVEEAIAQYRALSELRKDDPMPRICIARLELHGIGDADSALETVEAAFDFIDEEADLVEAVYIKTEALLVLDRAADARQTLSELSTSVIDDAELALDLAELALGAEDHAAATRWIDSARKLDDSIAADALHLQGRVHEATEERAKMIAAWQQVRVLDAKLPAGDVTITDDEVEQIALDTLAELPQNIRTKLERVPILIDTAPSEEQVADGLDPRILGLFQGTPMPETGNAAPAVTNILLFKTNLERFAHDEDHLAEEVRITVLHETAHYFGLDEEDLEKLGLD
jgi:predicted Zn-dependent protease with MMP-like domain